MKLQIYFPVKPQIVIQPFGVNGQYYRDHGINVAGHSGIDFQAAHGQPVRASHDGNAYFETDANGGKMVVIRTNQVFDYVGDPRYTQVYFKTIYCHLCDGAKEPKFASLIKAVDLNGPGQPIKRGDVIGYADSTGFSTGDHLHFGLKPVGDGEQPGLYYNIEQDNGYQGAIDPAPYFNGLYAEDATEAAVAAAKVLVAATKIVSEVSTAPISVADKISLLELLKRSILALAEFLSK